MQRKFKTFSVPGWLTILCVVLSIMLAGRKNFRTDEKKNLPKLYEYDDFKECRKEHPNFQYCVMEVVIQPDYNSELWNNISKISSSNLNFPRDHLERGICLQDCMKRFNESERSDAMDIDDSQRLHYLSYCAKESFQRLYNLQTSVSVKNCVTNTNLNYPMKLSEITFIVTIAIIVFLVGFATIFENIRNQLSFLIEVFSLKRNMARLLNTVDQPTNLQFLDGIRTIFMVIVLTAHSTLPVMRTPLTNPEDMELQTNSFLFPFFNSFNTHVISTSFSIAGMVQSVSISSAIEKCNGTIKFDFVLKKIFRRLANLVPAYAFIIFYQATLFPRTKSTPIAYKYPDYCDRHWWTNLLFINNYVHADEPCLSFGWYLGVDFHLFLVGAAVMMVIWRFPRSKLLCVYLMVAISFVIPAFIIYTEKLDATLTFDMRHVLTNYRTFDGHYKYYIPTSVNAGHYFFGMVAGLIYHYISKHDNLYSKAIPFSTKLFTNVSVIFLVLNGFLTVLPTLPKPSIILALYGSALKMIWSITNGTLLLYLALRPKSNVVSLLARPVMQIAARLSYCIYIVQYSVVYTVYSNLRIPITHGVSNTLFVTSVISFVTCACGLLLYLTVQLPCSVLLNRVIGTKFEITKHKILRQQITKTF